MDPNDTPTHNFLRWKSILEQLNWGFNKLQKVNICNNCSLKSCPCFVSFTASVKLFKAPDA